MKLPRLSPKSGGFTLVELLIVVIILAILAAVAIPQFSSSTDEAKLSALDSSLSSLRSAVDLYKQQHGHYPGTVAPNSGPNATPTSSERPYVAPPMARGVPGSPVCSSYTRLSTATRA